MKKGRKKKEGKEGKDGKDERMTMNYIMGLYNWRFVIGIQYEERPC